MEDKDFIKKFNEISINKICKKMGINNSNVYAGKLSKEKTKIIRDIIEFEMFNLLLESKKLSEEEKKIVEMEVIE